MLALLTPIALASAALGVLYALTVNDGKRLLAWSTLAQMGLVLLSPGAGGAMALSHGLAKAGLFLTARHWPGRSLHDWRGRPLAWSLQLPLWLGALSISGLPPLLGSVAKKELETALSPALSAVVLVLSIGSVALYARLCRAPWLLTPRGPLSWGALLLSLPLLLAGVAFGAGDAATPALLESLAVLLLGVVLALVLERWRWPERLALPQLDRLPDLLGGLGIVGAGLLVTMRDGMGALLNAGAG